MGDSARTDGHQRGAHGRSRRWRSPDGRRAQSHVIGVVLLTAVVVVLTGMVGVAAVENVSSQVESGPMVDVFVTATTQSLVVEHNGGEAVAVADLSVLVIGDNRERYELTTFTQRRGTDATTFEPGDKWRRISDVEGRHLRVLLIHEPSGTIPDEETVSVVDALAARFTQTPVNPTPLDTVTFDAGVSAVEAGGSISLYEWDFDDDGITDTTGETAARQFPDDGTYPVTLTVTSSAGETANRTKDVRVFNAFPTANFTHSPTNPYPDDVIAFDGSQSRDPDGTIVSYEWDFDDDGTTDATGSTPTHAYSTGGEYTTRLTVTDDDGAMDKRGRRVDVTIPSAPTVTITSVTVNPSGGSGKYDVDVTFEATDPDGDITNYTASLYNSSNKNTLLDTQSAAGYDGSSTTLTLSDSDTQIGESPLYLEVRVGDNTSRVGTDSQLALVGNQPPTADFTASPSDPSAGESVTFDASASGDPDGDSLTYEWDWTSDGTYEASGQVASHSYATAGTHAVTLRVSDGVGGTDSVTKSVVVGGGGSAQFTASIDAVQDNSQDCNRNPGGNCRGGDPLVEFDVTWSASEPGGDLQSATVELIDPTGTTVASQSYTYPGVGSASDTVTLTHDPGEWNSAYTIRLTAANSTASVTDSRVEQVG